MFFIKWSHKNNYDNVHDDDDCNDNNNNVNNDSVNSHINNNYNNYMFGHTLQTKITLIKSRSDNANK